MKYIALLRGINVGGKNKVEMKRLKKLFEDLGFTAVVTYINSGNVIFDDDEVAGKIRDKIDEKLKDEFGFEIRALIVPLKTLEKIHNELPPEWQNDTEMKCDVLFLWHEQNNREVLKQISIKPGIDNVKWVDGAIIWSIERKFASKSGLLKIVGTDLYKQVTIRNCNTVRKLLALAAD